MNDPQRVQVSPLKAEDLVYVPQPGEAPHVKSGARISTGKLVGDLYYRVIKKMDQSQDPDMVWRMHMGFTWENVLERVYKLDTGRREALLNGVTRPPIFVMDDVGCAPDGFKPAHKSTGEPGYITEYKATWKSAKKLDDFEHEFKPWIWQVVPYCIYHKVLVAVFYPMCFLGEYGKEPEKRRVGAYRVVKWFTQEELASTWKMLLGHKAQMEKMGMI